MTKQELISAMIDNKIVRVQVVSIENNNNLVPCCFILGSGQRAFGWGKDEVPLDKCANLLFNGDVKHTIKHLKSTYSGHVVNYDYTKTLQQLIEEQLELL